MAIRIITCIGLLYQDLIKTRKVFPGVLAYVSLIEGSAAGY